MDFSFPPEVEAFRTEVKAFLAENFDESMLDVTHDGTMHVPELHAALAAEGWLAGPVPKVLGGGGRTAREAIVQRRSQLEQLEGALANYEASCASEETARQNVRAPVSMPWA